MFLSKVACDFLAYDDSPDGWRNYGCRLELTKLLREQSADMRGHCGVLQQKRALEKLAAMQTRAENEVTLQEGAGLTEKFKDVAHEKVWNGCKGCNARQLPRIDQLSSGWLSPSPVAALTKERPFFCRSKNSMARAR